MTRKTIHVLNPQGKDFYQEFETQENIDAPAHHPPINFHAYAAATHGCFAQFTEQVIDKEGVVLVLLRRRMGRALKAIKKLHHGGFTVWITFKETGAHQIASCISRIGNRTKLTKCIALANAIVIPSPAARHFFRNLEIKDTPLIDLPTPYPVDHPAWSTQFTEPLPREGIMIGTREFNVPTRNHAAAIRIAAQVATKNHCRLTIVNPKGKKFRDHIRKAVGKLPEKLLDVIDQSLPYRDYLELIRSHRVIFQLDTSGVPGQVAGDCLLANTLCVGGNGEIESIAFPDYAMTTGELDCRNWIEILDSLITDDALYTKSLEKSQAIAKSSLSFGAFRQGLESLRLS